MFMLLTGRTASAMLTVRFAFARLAAAIDIRLYGWSPRPSKFK